MRIDIVGGGAIGLLHAARLALGGESVTVWTRTESQAELLDREGIQLWGEQQERQVARVVGRCLSSVQQQASASPVPHWIILTVKQGHINKEFMEQLGHLGGQETGMLCLQNGIGHLDKLALALPDFSLYAGVTTEGAKRIDANTVQHTGHGELWLGMAQEKESKQDQYEEIRQKLLLKALETAGFSVFLSNESNKIKDRIYQKLLINAVINPLTAIFDVTNGDLPKHPARLRLMKALYIETELIMLADGMSSSMNGWQRILEVCKSTAPNVSSMLSDVRAGNLTEIDWINGGVSRLAERLGLPSPLNDAVSAMVRRMEADEAD